jgi:flagellar assembly factor FliW
MKTAALDEQEKVSSNGQVLIQLPFGLLGFEDVKNYILLANPHEEPFAWIQMLGGPRKSFLVLPPFIVSPAYRPDISEADIQFLEIAEPSDATLLCICTLHKNEPASINLKGPIVINRHTMIGKQCIPENANILSARHPLPIS